jgi:uncharacterized protein (DUF2237 family)
VQYLEEWRGEFFVKIVTATASSPNRRAGDRWCLCAMRWLETLAQGVAPPVVLESTHERALAIVTLEQLKTTPLVR